MVRILFLMNTSKKLRRVIDSAQFHIWLLIFWLSEEPHLIAVFVHSTCVLAFASAALIGNPAEAVDVDHTVLFIAVLGSVRGRLGDLRLDLNLFIFVLRGLFGVFQCRLIINFGRWGSRRLGSFLKALVYLYTTAVNEAIMLNFSRSCRLF